MADDVIDGIITALDTFQPSDYDVENLVRLYEIFTGFRSLRDCVRVMLAMFSLLERLSASGASPSFCRTAGQRAVGYVNRPTYSAFDRRSPTAFLR